MNPTSTIITLLVSLALLFANPGQILADIFDPRDIPDLGLWLDAQDPRGNGVPLVNATAVTTWSDKSGLGNHATQNTPDRRPLYVDSGLNGRPSMRFDGTNDWFDVPPMFNLNSVTCFLVGQSLPEVNIDGGAFITGQHERFYIWRTFTNGPNNPNTFMFMLYGGSNRYQEFYSPADNEAHTFVLQNSGLVDGARGFVDGTSITPGTWPRSAEPIWLTLGTFNHGSYCLDGYISEVLIYNRGLSDSERVAVESYLSAKWGTVPEPSSFILLTVGAMMIVVLARYHPRFSRSLAA
jgi:hypothetical protein